MLDLCYRATIRIFRQSGGYMNECLKIAARDGASIGERKRSKVDELLDPPFWTTRGTSLPLSSAVV